jgi:phosphopantetheine adenylyltransferase
VDKEEEKKEAIAVAARKQLLADIQAAKQSANVSECHSSIFVGLPIMDFKYTRESTCLLRGIRTHSKIGQELEHSLGPLSIIYKKLSFQLYYWILANFSFFTDGLPSKATYD